jgi:TM2 domain-containing membrane protein YozV
MTQTKNPGVAAILSFIIPGLGQIYNGEIRKGILYLIGYLIAFASITIFVGFLAAPVIWIYGMIDAYKTAEKMNKENV